MRFAPSTVQDLITRSSGRQRCYNRREQHLPQKMALWRRIWDSSEPTTALGGGHSQTLAPNTKNGAPTCFTSITSSHSSQRIRVLTFNLSNPNLQSKKAIYSKHVRETRTQIRRTGRILVLMFEKFDSQRWESKSAKPILRLFSYRFESLTHISIHRSITPP